MTLIETGESSKQECKTIGCSAKTNTLYNTVTKEYTHHEYGVGCDCFYNHIMAWESKTKEIKKVHSLLDY